MGIRRSSARASIALCFAILVALPGCTTKSRPGSGEQTSSIKASASPAASPMSAEDYDAQVASFAAKIDQDFAAIRSHRGYKHLADKVQSLANDVEMASVKLGEIPAPADDADANSELSSSLSDLATSLNYLSNDVSSRKYCTGTAAATAISSRGPISDVAKAVSGISGVPPGSFSFPHMNEKATKLHNGAFLINHRNGAHGSLSIQNKNKTGAVVTLFKGRKATIAVYVAPKQKVSFSGIPDGVYRVYGQSGLDWDKKLKAFGLSCAFWKQKKPMTFVTSSSSSSQIVNHGGGLALLTTTTTTWKNWTLTLGGKSKKGSRSSSKPVAPDKYPKNAS